MSYTTQPLACDPTKLKGFSERLLVSHYENNYGGAVRRLNAITAQLASLDVATAPVFVLNGLKREELIATNSMILHELYFDSLGAEGAPDATLREALTRDFGSIERWQSEFVAMGKALGGGSGWVLLMYTPRDARLVNQWAADHTCCLAGGVPLLALDMYEHAYHIDYGAQAAAYVDAFMQNIHWDHVVQRYHAHARSRRGGASWSTSASHAGRGAGHPRCRTPHHLVLRIGLARAVLAVRRWRADSRPTSPLVSWVGLAGWAALWVGPPLGALVRRAPVF